jgi:acyl carrier protein
MSDVLEKIKLIISQQLEIKNERVTENARIVEDLGADSLDVVELLSILEENFDIQIPTEEGDKITTVRDLVFCIEEKNKQK